MCRLVHEWHTKCPFSQDFPPVVSFDLPQLSQIRLAIGFLSYLFVPAIAHKRRRDNRMRQCLGNLELLRKINNRVCFVRGDDAVGESPLSNPLQVTPALVTPSPIRAIPGEMPPA
jgi:hypothetical protein